MSEVPGYFSSNFHSLNYVFGFAVIVSMFVDVPPILVGHGGVKRVEKERNLFLTIPLKTLFSLNLKLRYIVWDCEGLPTS